jgi:hypothetical protein
MNSRQQFLRLYGGLLFAYGVTVGWLWRNSAKEPSRSPYLAPDLPEGAFHSE